MQPVDRLRVSTAGVDGSARSAPFRHVLIVPSQTLDAFNLQPGDLRENIIVDCRQDIHELESGTLITIGEVPIRLTFHCEPCRVIAHKVHPGKIMHRRGFLGSVLAVGEISLGDPVTVGQKDFEAIPYAIPDRLVWFLERQPRPLSLVTLLYEIGLSASYARYLAGLVRSLPPNLAGLVRIEVDERSRDAASQGVLF